MQSFLIFRNYQHLLRFFHRIHGNIIIVHLMLLALWDTIISHYLLTHYDIPMWGHLLRWIVPVFNCLNIIYQSYGIFRNIKFLQNRFNTGPTISISILLVIDNGFHGIITVRFAPFGHRTISSRNFPQLMMTTSLNLGLNVRFLINTTAIAPFDFPAFDQARHPWFGIYL